MLIVVLAMTFGYRDTFVATDRRPILKMAADSVGIIWRSQRLRTLLGALFLLSAGWMLALIYVPLAITALYQGDHPGTAVGLVLGAGALTTLVFAPAMGAAADRYGRWRVLLAGVAVELLLWPAPGLFRDLIGFTVAWALLSGVVSGVTAISFAVLSGSASSDIRGRVMAFSTLPMIAGSMVGPAIGSVVTAGSVFTVFPVGAGMSALGMGVLVLAARQATVPATRTG
jgi:MFS family permease